MATKNTGDIEIGGRLFNTATGNVVAGADAIKDEAKNRYQNDINSDVVRHESEIHGKNGINDRLDAIEAAESITYEGGSAQIAQASDFENPDATKRAKIPTVGAILDGLDADGAFDVSAKYPTIGVEGGNTYTLESALAVLNANLSANKKKGGMSIKFIQNSDNKYVQFRCVADEFTTDTTQWAIADEGVYVENPEFFYVKNDGEGKILWAIKIDGGIYYGAGVPQQVIDYIDEKIAELSLDEYEDIVAFLNGLEEGDKTLQNLLDEKVDKEEGKSLIDAEYANGVHYIENPEFAEVKVDNEDRILEAIMKDGTKLLPAGVKVIGTAEYDGATIKTVENPEFAGVWLDSEDKILFGVEQDGNFLFGCGVPKQVKEYIEQKIEELSLDEYESIVAFIGDYLNNTTLEELLSKKVDGEYVENPEFIEAKVDAYDKVLEGTKADGTKVINGDAKILGNMEVSGVSYKVIENPDYLAAWVDAEDKIIFGIKADGKTCVGDADFLNDIDSIKAFIQNITDKNIDWDALSSITTVENPEFIEAKTDVEGKLLAGRTPDGAAFEKVGFTTPKVSIDGMSTETLDDPENRIEISLDKDKKILNYRDKDGMLHENVGIITEYLELSENGLSDFEQALKAHGFTACQGDWSDSKELHIAEPYCALVNISGIDAMPTTKTDDAHAYMEFWDMAGNYFKKEVIANAQGRSSMQHPKKNISIDICNNNGWDDGDTFNLQIGDWIPQDSFHLKAFYTDPFRCLGAVAYKLYDEILKSRGDFNDYVWKRALLDLSSITATSTGCADAEEAIEGWNSNARCFPMGFPCIIYLNGEFYGIYSWQLKKSRENYMMSKKKTKHIHLDGAVNYNTILNANGDKDSIVWTTDSPEGIEIRNPKPKKKKDGWDLLMMNGEKYDADNNGGELIDETSDYWDANDESCIKSKEVKQYIINLSKVAPAIAAAYTIYEASSQTDADKANFKAVFETYFDVNNLIDYLIFSEVLANFDGFASNVQWISYNGVKWYLCAYDLDNVMGNWWELNDTIYAPYTTHNNWGFFQYLNQFYTIEQEARYKDLRDKGIISVSHIFGLVEAWIKRIGDRATFDKEWAKWPGFIKNDNLHRLYKWLQTSITNMDSVYNYN